MRGEAERPQFTSCETYQAWWNKVGATGKNHLYYLEKWHSMAKKCWPPKSYMLTITSSGEQIDLIATHDDLVDIHHRSESVHGTDPSYAKALTFFYHLCASTTDILYPILQKQKVTADLQALRDVDYLRIVGCLAKYSSHWEAYVHYVEIRAAIEAHFKDRIKHLKGVLANLGAAIGHL